MSEMPPTRIWVGNDAYLFIWNSGGEGPSRRLLGAFGRGEITVGGLAEAGWTKTGTLPDGGPIFVKREV